METAIAIILLAVLILIMFIISPKFAFAFIVGGICGILTYTTILPMTNNSTYAGLVGVVVFIIVFYGVMRFF